jgi:Fanconi anemia group M protein
MHEMLRGQREEEKEMVGQKALEEFNAEKVKVIADHREIPSGVVRELTKLGVEVEARQLDVGDFILSDRVGVERKSVKDFLQSIVDKRLMEQAQRLGETFERPMLILEGEGLYSLRAIHPNAIRGALSALAIDFGIPILPTRDEKETAAMLAIVARREQIEQTREVAIRGSARKLTLPEQQRFIVEGLPGVSAVLAKRLLEHFGTVERVMGASEKELQEVHGIGTEKAKEIRKVLSALYEIENIEG